MNFSPGSYQFPNRIFLAEAFYSTTDRALALQLVKTVNQIIKDTRQREKMERDNAALQKQEELKLSRDPRMPVLERVASRPSFKKNILGRLECHINGLRYITSKGVCNYFFFVFTCWLFMIFVFFCFFVCCVDLNVVGLILYHILYSFFFNSTLCYPTIMIS